MTGPTGVDDAGWSLVSFYRWHLADPVVFARSVKVTLQQIGGALFTHGDEAELERFKAEATVAGHGVLEGDLGGGIRAFSLYERSDDWCATGFAYCADPQPVPRCDIAAAARDLTGVPDGHRSIVRK